MGAVNVGAVLTSWWDVSHRSRTVLVAMAHLALDTGRPDRPARRYFAGVGYLAEVLYGPDGVEGHDRRGEPIATPSAARQVEKCITELVRAGALRRVVRGGPGRRAEYEVVLARPTDSVGQHPTDSVGQHPTDSVGRERPIRSGSGTTTGTTQENKEDNTSSSATTDTREADPSRHESESGTVWHDVPLIPGPEHYDAARNAVQAHWDPDAASLSVARYVDTYGLSTVDAVLKLATDIGWTP